MNEKVRGWLKGAGNPEKSAYIWNTISAMENSFQTMGLLLVITRLHNMGDAAIFSIAYAVGNLWIALGKYGIRHFQVTDVKEKYSYETYLRMRYFSCFFMLLASLIYIAVGKVGGYSWYKAACVLLACLIKLVDAFEDVLHGRLQQKEKLYIAGKVLSLRLFLYIICFVVLYIVTGNLLLTFLVSFLFTLTLAVYLNGLVRRELEADKESVLERGKVRELMLECLPLCVSFFLNTYLFNAPKYLLDELVSDEVQSCFNVIFMPVFVISLLSNFIFQPMLHKSAVLWEKKEYKKFHRIICKQTIIIIGLTLLADVGGWFLGIPVLGWIFDVKLESYRMLLILLISSGGVSAYINFMHMVLTTLRKQNILLLSYLLTAAAMLFAGRYCMRYYGLTAMTVMFLGLLLLLAIVLTVAYLITGRQKSVEIKREF